MQLAAVDSVSRGAAYFTCSYAADLAVCSDSYLTELSTFSGDLAVVAACIAYEQFTVTQCGMTGVYAVLQNYVADFACGCSYFAVFIYGEVVVCSIECTIAVYEERHNTVFICSTYGQVVFGIQCIGLNGVCIYITVFIYGEFIVCCVECAGAVYKERHDSVFCHSTYGQVVFGVQSVSLNGVNIKVFVQLNLNLSAVMAYADVLVAAEVNIIAGFNVSTFIFIFQPYHLYRQFKKHFFLLFLKKV